MVALSAQKFTVVNDSGWMNGWERNLQIRYFTVTPRGNFREVEYRVSIQEGGGLEVQRLRFLRRPDMGLRWPTAGRKMSAVILHAIILSGVDIWQR